MDRNRLIGKFCLSVIVCVILFAAFPLLLPSYGDNKIPTDQKTADGIYEEALVLISKGNYIDAATLLQQFVSYPLKYPKPVSDYIVLLVWTGKSQKAIKNYEALPLEFPRAAYLLRNIAKAYYDEQDYLKSVSLYQLVFQQKPDDTEALKGFVLSLVALGDYDKGLRYLAELQKRQPDILDLKILYSRALFSSGRYIEALNMYRKLGAEMKDDSENIFYARDKQILDLTDEKKRLLVAQVLKAASADKQAIPDYIIVLAMMGDYNTAISEFYVSGIDQGNAPFDMLNWLAWSYFKIDDKEHAKNIYVQVLSSYPQNKLARIGFYCMTSAQDFSKSLEILDSLYSVNKKNSESLYAKAYMFEIYRDVIGTIYEYDKIIASVSDSTVAKKMRLKAIADLGANTSALNEAQRNLPLEEKFYEDIAVDTAVDRLKWGENTQALNMLFEQQKNPKNIRAKFNYIAALVESKYMKEAVQAYETLVRCGIQIPGWVLEYVAGAYLYLENPHKASELYSKALNIDPSSYRARIGMFYALKELRKWNSAEITLSSLEKDFAAPKINGGLNLKKLDIAYERGWFLISQDRLQEAEKYFWNLYNDAPGNNEIRSGLAHTYYYRGWPRRALEEFTIISNLEPQELGFNIGKAMTMNALDQKNEARWKAKKLMSEHPKEKHVQALVRELQVEDMDEITANFSISSETGGFGDFKYYLSYAHLFSPYTKGYTFISHERSRDSEQTNYFRRAGFGVNYILNRYWVVDQQFSANYDDGKDLGSVTSLTFTPDDFWSFLASYDTFTSDVPFRAKVAGVTSTKADIGITYRESELSDYRLTLTRYDFSDSNIRESMNIEHSRQIFLKYDWKMRLFFDFYTSRNSLENADYFNPDSDWKISLTHMTEHVIRSLYKHSWSHNLSMTIGTYKQSGFSNKTDTGLKYEHDIAFSDTQSLLIGTSFGRNHYDGSPSNAYTFYLTYRGRL